MLESINIEKYQQLVQSWILEHVVSVDTTVQSGLILIALAEAQDANIWLVHGMGIALLVGRIAHAHGFGQEPETTNYRTRGMQLTFAVLAAGALTNIVAAFQ